MTGRRIWQDVTFAAAAECPPAEAIACLVDGRMTAEEREHMLVHLSDCSSCANAAAFAVDPGPAADPVSVERSGLWRTAIVTAIAAALLLIAAAIAWRTLALRKSVAPQPLTIEARIEIALRNAGMTARLDAKPIERKALDLLRDRTVRGADAADIVAPRGRSPLDHPDLVIALPAGARSYVVRFLDARGNAVAPEVRGAAESTPLRLRWPDEARKEDGVLVAVDIDGARGAVEIESFVRFAAPEDRDRWSAFVRDADRIGDPADRALVIATAAYRAGYFAEAAQYAAEAAKRSPDDALLREFADLLSRAR